MTTESPLVRHAHGELKRAGLFKKDSDYDGGIGETVLALVKLFAEQGHSGMSAVATLSVFDKVARFKPLTMLTNDPSEWMEVGHGVWQSCRDSECFSTDGGKTYYNLNRRSEILTAGEAGAE